MINIECQTVTDKFEPSLLQNQNTKYYPRVVGAVLYSTNSWNKGNINLKKDVSQIHSWSFIIYSVRGVVLIRLLVERRQIFDKKY